MNKYEHAAQSATIFGGKSSEYLEFHDLIDNNKLVTPSIFGRFFLHHFDIGLFILEKIFGQTIGKKKVEVKKLLLQHLFEDYDQVLTFEKHWAPALYKNKNQLPAVDTWEYFVQKASRDPRLEKFSRTQLEKLDKYFRLVETEYNEQYKDLIFAITGHALGGDLIVRLIGPKFEGAWTSDVAVGYLNCRFNFTDRNRDQVPTLLDYEQHVPDIPWMHAPKDYSDTARINPKAIQKKIEDFLKKKEVNTITGGGSFHIRKRRPCNAD